MVTIPAMLSWHVLIGLGEGAITTSLVMSLQRLQPAIIGGLTRMRNKVKF
jgi:ABC-type Co2+ transport system permease subunit